MRRVLGSAVLVLAVLAGTRDRARQGRPLDRIGHIVVIYEENHSFDNLYGGWEGVDGLKSAPAARTPGRPGRQRRTSACSRTTST